MGNYKLSKKADEKITEIYKYSLLNFGEIQADKYYLSLHSTLELLAGQPKLGRVFHEFRRHEHGSHVVFYVIEPYGIFVIDILHENEDVLEKITQQ